LLGDVRDGHIGIVGLANLDRGPGAEDADLGVGVFVPQVEEETGTGPEDAEVLVVYGCAVADGGPDEEQGLPGHAGGLTSGSSSSK
jgi:hypothetical protein